MTLSHSLSIAENVRMNMAAIIAGGGVVTVDVMPLDWEQEVSSYSGSSCHYHYHPYHYLNHLATCREYRILNLKRQGLVSGQILKTRRRKFHPPCNCQHYLGEKIIK